MGLGVWGLGLRVYPKKDSSSIGNMVPLLRVRLVRQVEIVGRRFFFFGGGGGASVPSGVYRWASVV